jgi:hypothetical protein
MADEIVLCRGPAKIGRPSIYTPELADRLCKAIAGGTTLLEVCRQEWAPSHDTIYEWRKSRPEFSDALAHARKQCAGHLAESTVGIVDAVETDSDYGAARVSKAREQVGVRRWLAGCLDRDTYGDKQQVDVRATMAHVVAFADLERKPVDADVVASGEAVMPRVVVRRVTTAEDEGGAS